MLISIIIPAFNEEKSMKYIVECIQYAINGNSHREYSWELIVCDNNSTDKTVDIATELGCRVGTANFQGTKFRSKLAAGQLSKSVYRKEGLRSNLGDAHASLSLKFLTNFIR